MQNRLQKWFCIRSATYQWATKYDNGYSQHYNTFVCHLMHVIWDRVIGAIRLEVKCKLRTCGPDLRIGKGLGLGFMLRIKVIVSVRVKIKIRFSSSILPHCRSAGSVRRSAFYPLPCNPADCTDRSIALHTYTCSTDANNTAIYQVGRTQSAAARNV